MNAIVLRSAGKDIPYTIESGHFDLSEGKVDIALELMISDTDNEDSPPELLVRLANLEFPSQPSTLHVRDWHEDWHAGDDGRPHAFVYSGFHHPNVSAWVDIISLDETELSAEIRVVTDDARYDDERATDNTMSGQCLLTRQSRHDMWLP